MSANLRLSWAGDFDRLKEFVKSDLELQGSWSSPANEKKLDLVVLESKLNHKIQAMENQIL